MSDYHPNVPVDKYNSLKNSPLLDREVFMPEDVLHSKEAVQSIAAGIQTLIELYTHPNLFPMFLHVITV